MTIKFLSTSPQLPSKDFSATIEFMTSKLGFELAHQYPTLIIFKRAGQSIHFFTNDNVGTLGVLAKNSSCYFYVDNVSALENEFKEKQVDFIYEVTDQPWGMREFQVDDPHGNSLRFGSKI